MKPADTNLLIQAWENGQKNSQASECESPFVGEPELHNGAPKKALIKVISYIPKDVLEILEKH